MAISDTLLSFLCASLPAVPANQSAGTTALTTTTSRTTTVLPPGASILLTDSLAVSAQPWLVHFVARALRPTPLTGPPSHHQQTFLGGGGGGGGGGASTGLDTPPIPPTTTTKNKKRRTVVLGVREREEWWTGVLKKSAIQLATERSSGHFRYLSLSDPSIPLVDSFRQLQGSLANPATADQDNEVGPLVVLDDVSALAWMGHGVREVLQWWNGLRSLLEANRATLVTLQHYAPAPAAGLEEDIADTYLFRALLQRSDFWLQVEPLGGGGTAGMASSTSGEISVHLAPSYLPVPPFAIDPSCGALSASGPLARPFWVDEAAGGVEIGVKGRGRLGGAGQWA